MLVVSQPPPLAFLVFLLSDWREACVAERRANNNTPNLEIYNTQKTGWPKPKPPPSIQHTRQRGSYGKHSPWFFRDNPKSNPE